MRTAVDGEGVGAGSGDVGAALCKAVDSVVLGHEPVHLAAARPQVAVRHLLAGDHALARAGKRDEGEVACTWQPLSDLLTDQFLDAFCEYEDTVLVALYLHRQDL